MKEKGEREKTKSGTGKGTRLASERIQNVFLQRRKKKSQKTIEHDDDVSPFESERERFQREERRASRRARGRKER